MASKNLKILMLSDASSIHTERWIQALISRGHTVEHISFKKKDFKGIKTHFLPTYGIGKLGYLLSFFKIQKILKAFNPDIVHAHHITSYGFLASLLGFKATVLTAWGSDVLITPRESIIYKIITKYALNHCSKITVVAEHMQECIEEYGVQKNKIKVIPFGVDLQIFKPNMKAIETQVTLLSTRNFTPIYSIDTLIKAIPVVIKEVQFPIMVKLAGKGPLLENYKNLISELKIEKNFEFIGHLSQKELAKTLSQSDLFISTAISDGNNISLNEAMACGAYPIATNIAANSQWIEDQVNGRLFEVNNHHQLASNIIESINNKSHLANAIEKNYEIVKNRANWESNVTDMISLYYDQLKISE